MILIWREREGQGWMGTCANAFTLAHVLLHRANIVTQLIIPADA